VVGDVVGAIVDGATGNIAGCVQNSVDAVEDVFEAAGADGVAGVLTALNDVASEVIPGMRA
jgi:hypothetical protein